MKRAIAGFLRYRSAWQLELYPSKEALERAGGSEDGLSESFEQREAFLATSAS